MADSPLHGRPCSNQAKLYNVECGPGKFSVCEFNGFQFEADAFYHGHDHSHMTEHMEAIQQMEIRYDDVFLLTYPKSGTHLVREICHMLQVGRIEYISEEMEFALEYRDIYEVSSLKSPRILHTHLWYHMLPRKIQEGKHGKVIAVFRNPKDVIVSFWHFMSNRFQTTLPIDIFTKLQITDKPGNIMPKKRNKHNERRKREKDYLVRHQNTIYKKTIYKVNKNKVCSDV